MINLIGPSHVLRISHYLKSKVLPNVFPSVNIIGNAGMPIWHDIVIDSNTGHGQRSLFLVGDFRFGNRIFDPEFKKGDSVFGIEKKLISKDHDILLFNKSLDILDSLHVHGASSFLFWDLFFREQRNKENNRYLDDENIYVHPIWNYESLKSKYHNVLDLKKYCGSSWKDFIIDSSNHPSILGHILISSLYNEVDYNHDLVKSVIKKKITLLFDDKFLVVTSPRIIRKLKALLAPFCTDGEKLINFVRDDKIATIQKSQYDKIVYVSDETFMDTTQASDLNEVLTRSNLLKNKCAKLHVLLSSYSAINALEIRKKNKKHKHSIPNFDSCYEINNLEKIIPFVLPISDSSHVVSDSLYELRVSDYTFKFIFLLAYISRFEVDDLSSFENFYDFVITDIFNSVGITVGDVNE